MENNMTMKFMMSWMLSIAILLSGCQAVQDGDSSEDVLDPELSAIIAELNIEEDTSVPEAPSPVEDLFVAEKELSDSNKIKEYKILSLIEGISIEEPSKKDFRA